MAKSRESNGTIIHVNGRSDTNARRKETVTRLGGNGSHVVRNGFPVPKYLGRDGLFFHADCLKLLPHIQTDSIDLVFVDPPFNLGKQYEQGYYNDSMETEVYRNWCHDWLLQLVRVIRPGGALFLYHWPFWLMQLGAWLHTLSALEYKSWIAMKMKSGFPIRGRLHPAHYGLLYFVKKGAKPTFNVVRHRTPTCRHCGKMTRDYGGYRKKFEKFEDDEGIPWIQISDFWEDTRPARQDKNRDNTINELPLHVPERAILMASNPDDVILDIFGGGGSTFHAAHRHNRLWIGCELGDTTPTTRRISTFSNDAAHMPKARLEKCFAEEFWASRIVTADLKQLQRGMKRTCPLEKNPTPAMEEFASKSRVIGF